MSIELTDLVDSVIDCLTEPDGGHAVGNGDIKDAIFELKQIKALFIDVVVAPKSTLCELNNLIMTELEPEDFLMPYGICSDTTIGEQDKPLTELMQEYADKLLIIHGVVKSLPTKYSIAFAGFVATNIEVQGSELKVIDSINGFGEKIPNQSVSIIKK